MSFSNKEFYGGELIPLRIPTASERLAPSILDERVQYGTAVGAVVDKVKEYITSAEVEAAPPRSIGIICLVGHEQGACLDRQLRKAIGPDKYYRHDIMVGEPFDFQGAERDIIFLFLVCSPDSVSVSTQDEIVQARWANVALTRARYRMVLVRSVDLDDIPEDRVILRSIVQFFDDVATKDRRRVNDHGDIPSDDYFSYHTDFFSSLRHRGQEILTLRLEEEGFEISSMGKVWHGAICVRSANQRSRVAVLVDTSERSQEEWLKLIEQQERIESVGWKCLRLHILFLVNDLNSAVKTVVDFISTV